MNFIHTHRRITARHTLPPAHAPQFSTPQAGRFSLGRVVPRDHLSRALKREVQATNEAVTTVTGAGEGRRVVA